MANAVIDLIENEVNEVLEADVDRNEAREYDEENVIRRISALASSDAKIPRNERLIKPCKALSTWYKLVSLSILRYLEIYLECGRRMEASIKVANVLFGKSGSKDSYRASCIRFWAKAYLETGTLPDFRQGKHTKIVSIISREDVRQTFRVVLRNMKDQDRCPEAFMNALNNDTLRTMKAFLRKRCENNYQRMKALVPTVLDEHVSLRLVRRVCVHCLRFMDGYRRELDGPLLDFAMKKLAGKRRVPLEILPAIREDFNRYQQTKLMKKKN